MNSKNLLTTSSLILFGIVCTLNCSLANAGKSYDLRELGEGYESVVISHDVPPGVYKLDILLNGKSIDAKYDVKLIYSQSDLKPLIDRDVLILVGVDFERAPDLLNILERTGFVTELSNSMPSSSVIFDLDTMTLNFNIPQYFIVDQALNERLNRSFQVGENLSFVTYYANGFNIDDYNSQSLNLDLGVNYNGWLFRHGGAYFNSSNDSGKYNTYNNYVEKALVGLRSKVRMGSSFSLTNTDSFAFTGLSLKSESRMLPKEMQGFAPVVSGIAKSNAIVEILQNGILIYREVVSPGYFEISNLRSTGSSGDLEVLITEETGEQRAFIQPYSSSSDMLREGVFNYSIDLGKHDGSDLSEAYFINTNIKYGLTKYLTGEFRSLISKNYISYETKFDLSLNHVGVVSLGYQTATKDAEGYTVEASYTKDFSSTGTNITFSNYIYESEKWSSFNEYINALDYDHTEISLVNRKSRQGINVTQRLPFNMRANISGYKETYWDSKEQYNWTISTAKSFNFGTISMMYSEISSGQLSNDRQLFVNFNLPIGNRAEGTLNTSYRTDLNGQNQVTVGYSGTINEEKTLSYSAETSRDDSDTNGALSIEYKGSKAKLNVGYSKTTGSESINYGLAGSIVGLERGVVLSQPIGSTFAIVDTSGIEGVKVRSKPGVITNSKGLALVDYVSPYEYTNVSIDTSHTKGLSSDTESIRVIPSEGAGVIANFNTRKGIDLLITSKHNDKPIPFGTTITINDKSDTNVFGDDGQIFITSAPTTGVIKAYVYGPKNEPCLINYVTNSSSSELQFISAECINN